MFSSHMLASYPHVFLPWLSFRKLEDLSVDEFLLSAFDSAGEEDDSKAETSKKNGLSKKKSKKKESPKKWVSSLALHVHTYTLSACIYTGLST